MNGFRIARIGKIDIQLNPSVLVIVALLAWSLAESIFPELAEGYDAAEYWLAATATVIAFFAALLAHEMGHALVAQREGVGVRSITLWLFGGVAQLEAEPDTPGAAFRIAAMGPAVSIVLGVFGVAVGALLNGLLGIAVLWFGVTNLFLAFFNLLPAFPLDGGRIYQSWQWAKSGDPVAATDRAASAGLLIGAGLVALGVLQSLAGNPIGGVWMMLIGWFLRQAARQEVRGSAIRGPLSKLKVVDTMTSYPTIVDPTMTIAEFIPQMFFGGRHAAYPVGTSETEISGMVTLTGVRSVPRTELETTTVADCAIPLDRIVRSSPDEPITSLLSSLAGRDSSRALVFDGPRLVGIVAPSDLARTVSIIEVAGRSIDLTSPMSGSDTINS
ncbi:MAG: site-2 protease family protein [Acidimicrobiales bacterium]|nr:MAG: site-2 protease family protein [Acidimicrobiales bacterium]